MADVEGGECCVEVKFVIVCIPIRLFIASIKFCHRCEEMTEKTVSLVINKTSSWASDTK